MQQWAISFFYSPIPLEEKTLYICPADYLSTYNNEPYHTYLAQKKYLSDGYTKVVFNNFDFARIPALAPIFDIINPAFIFIQAEFTDEQVSMLLYADVDLTRFIYRTITPTNAERYSHLYAHCFAKGTQRNLHGVQVDLSDCNLISCPDDFVAVCNPISLTDSTLSQAQFDSLLLLRKKNTLNLSRLRLADIDISALIDEHDENITFDEHDLFLFQKKIILAETSVRDAIINIKILSKIAILPKYTDWFLENDLTFKVRIEDGLHENDTEIHIDEFIADLENKSGDLLSARETHTTLFQPPQKFYTRLKEELIKIDFSYSELNFENMPTGQKFLWVIHCAVEKPGSFLSQMIMRKFNSSQMVVTAT